MRIHTRISAITDFPFSLRFAAPFSLISDILAISQCLRLANPMRSIPSGTLEALKPRSRPLGTRTRKPGGKIFFNHVKKWFWKILFFRNSKNSNEDACWIYTPFLKTGVVEPSIFWKTVNQILFALFVACLLSWMNTLRKFHKHLKSSFSEIHLFVARRNVGHSVYDAFRRFSNSNVPLSNK